MTKREALELIAKTYPGQMEVTANERITDWQAAKHLHHSNLLIFDLILAEGSMIPKTNLFPF